MPPTLPLRTHSGDHSNSSGGGPNVGREFFVAPVDLSRGIKVSQLTGTYTDARSRGRIHDGIDIMAQRGTKVIAADDGTVVKLLYINQGGLTVYQSDPTEKNASYYAHLDSYAPGLVEGKQLRSGDPIGLVGSSGNASDAARHLLFEVSMPGPEKLWWKSTAINPYPWLRGH